MTTQIRFAQFVLDEINEKGYVYRGNIGAHEPWYFRVGTKYHPVTGYTEPRTHKDDYAIRITTFGVQLFRGPEYYLIKLTSEERRAFHLIDKKRRDLARKLQYDAWIAKALAKKNAQTWP